MKLARICGLAILPLALASCGADEGEPEAVLEDTAAAAPAPDSAVAPAPVAGNMTHVTMAPLGGSTAGGMAMVSSTGAAVDVNVQLTGLPEGAHAGHIHEGTCAAPGAPVAPLQEVTAGADGTGMITSTVEIDAATVTDGNHLIAYHERGAPDPGSPIVCGEIPAGL